MLIGEQVAVEPLGVLVSAVRAAAGFGSQDDGHLHWFLPCGVVGTGLASAVSVEPVRRGPLWFVYHQVRVGGAGVGRHDGDESHCCSLSRFIVAGFRETKIILGRFNYKNNN